MRFTPKAHLPPSEHIVQRQDVIDFCEYLSKGSDPFGFDTETSGLEQDGLGVQCHYICLANQYRRVAIPISEAHHENLDPVVRMLHDTQHRHCGFNVMYDWHALYGHQRFHLGRRDPILLSTCLADGMKLFLHFDEEGEDTFMELGLKSRARHYLNLPMNAFDRILISGGILRGFQEDYDLTLDYCTRDAWAHLGICTLGIQITKEMFWCKECPECGEPMFTEDRKGKKWQCVDHGWFHSDDCISLSIWDMHRRWDVPYLHTLSKIQIRGIPIDWGYLDDSIGPLTIAKNSLLRQFQMETSTALVQHGGPPVSLNPNSPQQLARFYHGSQNVDGSVVGIGLPILERTESGTPAMGERVLEKLLVRHTAPGVRSLIKFKKLSKILSTYVEGLQKHKFDKTGRVHGALRPWANTGRLRSYSPNLQNLPARDLVALLPPPSYAPDSVEEAAEQWGMTLEEAFEELAKPEYQSEEIQINIRNAVKAPPGKTFVCCDYAQLEVRLMANESMCADLIRVINEGVDMHCYTASRAFNIPYEALYEAKCSSDDDDAPRQARLGHLRDAYADGCTPGSPRWDDLVAHLPGLSAEIWESLQSGLEEQTLDLLGSQDKFLKGKRSAAKATFFGVIYGIGPTGLAAQITANSSDDDEPTTKDDAELLINSLLYDTFPGVGGRIAYLKNYAKQYGYVRTAMLRYRHPAGVTSGDTAKVAQALRQSQNSPIQGAAADVVNRAMQAIDDDDILKNLGFEMICQVHDELLLEGPEETAQEAKERVVYLMETAHRLVTPVPLTVSGGVAKTWGEAK